MTFLTQGFCKKNEHPLMDLKNDKYSIQIFDSIDDVEASWSIVSAAHDIFFSPEFLRCIEQYPATGIKPYYGIVKLENDAVGIIYFQSKYVKLSENLRKPGMDTKNMIQKLTEPFKHAVVSVLNFHTIICGNLLLTGKYGFYFIESIPKDDQFYLVIKATENLADYLKKRDIPTGLVLVKDFFTKDVPETGEDMLGLTKFTVQPKMLLDLQAHWKNFDDYLEDMKSKYRVRARKAMEKAADITKIVYDETDIAEHRDTINRLYRYVSDQADFNAFVLHEKYFENLKAALGKNMTFTTYWRQGKMVAFFTSIKNFDVLDAHFLGYDPAENTKCQLYLNMLYDLIREGIGKNMRQIDMSRTAVEIKSTVGAVPHDMYLYLRHSNAILNKTVETVLGFVKPEAAFVIRSPFREE